MVYLNDIELNDMARRRRDERRRRVIVNIITLPYKENLTSNRQVVHILLILSNHDPLKREWFILAGEPYHTYHLPYDTPSPKAGACTTNIGAAAAVVHFANSRRHPTNISKIYCCKRGGQRLFSLLQSFTFARNITQYLIWHRRSRNGNPNQFPS